MARTKNLDYALIEVQGGKLDTPKNWVLYDLNPSRPVANLNQLGAGSGGENYRSFPTREEAIQTLQVHSLLNKRGPVWGDQLELGFNRATPDTPFIAEAYAEKVLKHAAIQTIIDETLDLLQPY